MNGVAARLQELARQLLPKGTRLWLFEKRLWLSEKRIRGFAERLPSQPVSPSGFERGGAIDRYFIEEFLTEHSSDIRGRVLEFYESRYSDKLGRDRVTTVDVLDVVAGNLDAMALPDVVVPDSTRPQAELDAAGFDCIICIGVLQKILDVRPAIHRLRHMLKPGGVLLVTSHGISKPLRHPSEKWGDYWHLTSHSLETLLGEAFSPANVEVKAYGNVLAAAAFLYGMGVLDVAPEKLRETDADFEVIVAARAVRGEEEP